MRRFRDWLSESVWFDYTIKVLPESIYRIFDEEAYLEMARYLDPKIRTGSEEERYFTSRGFVPIKAQYGEHQGKAIWWHPKQGTTHPQGGGIPQTPTPQQPTATAAQPAPTEAQPGVEWVLAKIIDENAPELTQGQKKSPFQKHQAIGAQRSTDPQAQATWEITTLDAKRTTASVPEQRIAAIIQAIQKDGRPARKQAEKVTAPTLERLMKIAGIDPTTEKKADAELGRPWWLAKVINIKGLKRGSLVAAQKNRQTDDWDIVTLDGKRTKASVPSEKIARAIESVKKNDKQISSRSLEDLEAMAKTGKATDTAGLSDEDREKFFEKQMKRNEKYRISDDQITEHQKGVEKAFLGFDPRHERGSADHSNMPSIVINALAGTGKTTLLKHLAAFKQPGESWLYLVFNRKNADEAIASFPGASKQRGQGNIQANTSHGFLLELLREADPENIPRDVRLPKKKEPGKPKERSKVSDIINAGGKRGWFSQMATRDLGLHGGLIFPLKKRTEKLTELAKNFAVDPRDTATLDKALGDVLHRYPDQIDVTLQKGNKWADPDEAEDYSDEIIAMTKEVLKRCAPFGSPDKALSGKIDFDDILWWSTVYGGIQWPRYDVVLADEIQDFNNCQQIMLSSLAKMGARIVAVGDPNQAIYRFRGADSTSFRKLGEMLGATENGVAEHDLPTNFRCGQAIIDYVNARTHVDTLTAGATEDDPDRPGMKKPIIGEVTEDQSYANVMGQIGNELEEHNGELAQETAFISRTNAPLVAAALDCLTKDIDFEILGRDLSEEMNDVVGDIIGGQDDRRQVPIYMLIPRLEQHLENEEQILKTPEFKDDTRRHKEFKKTSDTIDSIKSVMGYVESRTRKARGMGDAGGAFTDFVNPKDPKKNIKTVEDFVWYLRQQFGGVETESADAMAKFMDRKKKKGKKFVTLTTAHRSKGMEWDRVFIAGADKFAWPDEPGAPGEEEMDAEEQQQEWNALYVALTRAKRGLHVLADKGEEIGVAA